MSKLKDWDWWMGRTPQQLARKQKARDDFDEAREDYRQSRTRKDSNGLGDRIARFGWKMTIVVTLPILGFLVFGLIGLAVAMLIALIMLAR